jgi:hypothetical protein
VPVQIYKQPKKTERSTRKRGEKKGALPLSEAKQRAHNLFPEILVIVILPLGTVRMHLRAIGILIVNSK